MTGWPTKDDDEVVKSDITEVIDVAGRSSASASKPWIRWQDWAGVVLGAYLILGTMWTPTNGGAMSAMIVLGALLLIASVWSLAMPGSMTSEYSHMLLGVLLFISPWVLGYAELMGASWTSWIAGVLAVVVGAAALPEANAAHRGGVAGQH
ncbi:SPW repeat protein [Saccharopolyspora sp. NPDC049357]|uniref:SPW repeat protein n=1 Tax=Saccharopolyspora sp. NPDC049357 TaxID=3154507 RepID=UPI00342B1525